MQNISLIFLYNESCWNDIIYIKLNENIIKCNFSCFFLHFVMWLQENLKLHMWLTLYLHWTALLYRKIEFKWYVWVEQIQREKFLKIHLLNLFQIHAIKHHDNFTVFYGCCCVCIHTYPNRLCFYLLFGCSQLCKQFPVTGPFLSMAAGPLLTYNSCYFSLQAQCGSEAQTENSLQGCKRIF